jgi:hypothetical protein
MRNLWRCLLPLEKPPASLPIRKIETDVKNLRGNRSLSHCGKILNWLLTAWIKRDTPTNQQTRSRDPQKPNVPVNWSLKEREEFTPIENLIHKRRNGAEKRGQALGVIAVQNRIKTN